MKICLIQYLNKQELKVVSCNLLKSHSMSDWKKICQLYNVTWPARSQKIFSPRSSPFYTNESSRIPISSSIETNPTFTNSQSIDWIPQKCNFIEKHTGSKKKVHDFYKLQGRSWLHLPGFA